jgi:uncharacterized membrane protein
VLGWDYGIADVPLWKQALFLLFIFFGAWAVGFGCAYTLKSTLRWPSGGIVFGLLVALVIVAALAVHGMLPSPSSPNYDEGRSSRWIFKLMSIPAVVLFCWWATAFRKRDPARQDGAPTGH